MTRRKRLVALGLLGAAALGLRWVAFDWGFPLKFGHIDESVVLFYSLRMVDGAWAPGFFDYPGLFFCLLAGAIRSAHALGHLIGFVPSMPELLAAYMSGDSRFFLGVSRGLTVIFALATVALTVDMGRRRSGWTLGLSAGALLAVNPLHVLHSHYGTVDVAAAFMTLLALDRIDVFWGNPTRRNGAGAAVAVGLGAAMKYYPGILLPLLIAEPFWRRRPGAAGWAAGLSAASLGAYALGSPETLVALPDFCRRFGHLFPKIVGTPGTSIPLVAMVGGLIVGLGPLVMGGAVAGAARVVRDRLPWKRVGVGAALLLGFIGLWRGHAPHYALALYPVAALFAALGFQWTGRRHRFLPLLLWGTSVLFGLGADVAELSMIRARDSRLEAADWVRARVAPGSKILRWAHTPEFNARDGYFVKVDFTNESIRDWAPGGPVPAALRGQDFLIYATYEKGDDAVLDALKERFALRQSFERRLPRFPHHPRVFIFDGHG
ncbi:MAG: glycosyltransferase family 39 protein [Elusimicrobia bacterium]|nr:glycosyltransferase family 39 protein [Elusimicrobiota bacterium]